ncbi:MAG: NAD(P)/FAD-dependent oxidoreductase [Propionibacteriales bacterium]|nr:NAD(P)/FAD-dependent oxidoreductase [Propionibacteriales bacterium]
MPTSGEEVGEHGEGQSRFYAPGAELKKYSEHIAQKYDLRRRMRFNSVVLGARWDEDDEYWIVSIADSESITARYILTATDFLSQPRMPDISGIETFAGMIIHTTKWDYSYDLTNRQVAVIGTGATAVQLIPEIAPKLAELTVYQRTAIWVTPKKDGPIPPRVQKLFARLLNTSLLELLMVSAVLHYKRAKFLKRAAERLARRHMERQLDDPELRRRLTPGYDFGCKRPTAS